MPDNQSTIGDKITGVVALIFVAAAFFGWNIQHGWTPDDWSPETSEQHQERLTCEMNQMTTDKMSSSDAEAYCAKEIEAERIYHRRMVNVK